MKGDGSLCICQSATPLMFHTNNVPKEKVLSPLRPCILHVINNKLITDQLKAIFKHVTRLQLFMVCCLHNSNYLTAYICFYVKRIVLVACFSNYIGNTRSTLSILSMAARGGVGGVPEGGRRSRELAFGWSGVTYLEPLPGLTDLWEEEREIAVLLV